MKKKACRSHPQWSGLLFAALAFLCSAPARAQSVDWSSYNGTLSADHFSPLTEITRANVGALREVCTFDTGEQIGFQAVPVVIAGTMFITTDTATYAFHASRRAPLEPTDLRIGRDVSNDVVLDDTMVSRRHAVVAPTAAGYAFVDLHSTNGSRIAGQLVVGEQMLAHGVEISIGSARLRFLMTQGAP